jgi:hypothetical protein
MIQLSSPTKTDDLTIRFFFVYLRICRGLLQALGFEVIATSQDYKATIPVAADLTAMDKTITRLIEEAKVPAR